MEHQLVQMANVLRQDGQTVTHCMQRLRVEEYGCSVVEVQITADFWIQPICEV
jgi:hypothetical protein